MENSIVTTICIIQSWIWNRSKIRQRLQQKVLFLTIANCCTLYLVGLHFHIAIFSHSFPTICLRHSSFTYKDNTYKWTSYPNTTEMHNIVGTSLSEQHTLDFVVGCGTQTMHVTADSENAAIYQSGQLHRHGVSFTCKSWAESLLCMWVWAWFMHGPYPKQLQTLCII